MERRLDFNVLTNIAMLITLILLFCIVKDTKPEIKSFVTGYYIFLSVVFLFFPKLLVKVVVPLTIFLFVLLLEFWK